MPHCAIDVTKACINGEKREPQQQVFFLPFDCPQFVVGVTLGCVPAPRNLLISVGIDEAPSGMESYLLQTCGNN